MDDSTSPNLTDDANSQITSHQKSLFPHYSLQGAEDRFKITSAQFDALRRADVRGTNNPSLMDNPVWKWMVLEGFSAWEAGRLVNKREASVVYSDELTNLPVPGWSFDRFRMTRTVVPDGRLVFVGGEHEDFYDPDFCIYNDIIVIESPDVRKRRTHDESKSTPQNPEQRPSSSPPEAPPLLTPDCIKIYSYPITTFPPIEFHTSTYIPAAPDPYILIIGGVTYYDGNPDTQDRTNIYRLNLTKYSIQQCETQGACPKVRLAEHAAELVGEREQTMVRVTTKEGERFGLRIRDLMWFD